MTQLFWSELSDKVSLPGPGVLSQYRVDKLSRIHSPEAFRASLGAELLLIEALRFVFGAVHLPLEISCDELGKPYLQDRSIYFNLSHSGSFVACALSGRPVGVDIQVMRRCRMELVKRYFSDTEQKEIQNSTDRDATFTRIWTRKESLLKAVGIGLRTTLKEVDISAENGSAVYGDQAYTFYEKTLEGAQLCLCFPGEEDIQSITCIRIELPG